MTSASTIWTRGRWAPYCRGREAASPSSLGSVPKMATAHVQVRSAARATLVACLQGPPPDASLTLTLTRYRWGSSCGGHSRVPFTTRREATKSMSGRGGGGGGDALCRGEPSVHPGCCA